MNDLSAERAAYERGLRSEELVLDLILEQGWPDVANVERVPRGDPRDARGVDLVVHLRDGSRVPVQVKSRLPASGSYRSRYTLVGIALVVADDGLSAMLRLRSWLDRRAWERVVLLGA